MNYKKNKIMNVNINTKKRLNKELINGVTLEQLKAKLYSEMDYYEDCGYTCQKIDTYKDIQVVEYWIRLENN
jgi:hypothetical protein